MRTLVSRDGLSRETEGSVRFKAAGGPEGAGWAVVMWRRTDRKGGSPPDGHPEEHATWAIRPITCGASVLEIRDGRIARDHLLRRPQDQALIPQLSALRARRAELARGPRASTGRFLGTASEKPQAAQRGRRSPN